MICKYTRDFCSHVVVASEAWHSRDVLVALALIHRVSVGGVNKMWDGRWRSYDFCTKFRPNWVTFEFPPKMTYNDNIYEIPTNGLRDLKSCLSLWLYHSLSFQQSVRPEIHDCVPGFSWAPPTGLSGVTPVMILTVGFWNANRFSMHCYYDLKLWSTVFRENLDLRQLHIRQSGPKHIFDRNKSFFILLLRWLKISSRMCIYTSHQTNVCILQILLLPLFLHHSQRGWASCLWGDQSTAATLPLIVLWSLPSPSNTKVMTLFNLG